MFNDELKSKLKDFWQSNLKEIQENKIRFAAVFICFVVAVIFYFADENSTGEEINLTETPAPVENPVLVEQVDTNKKIITVKNAATSNAAENITAVLGANSDDLYVADPFKVPSKPKIETPPPLPEIPAAPEIIQQPVAQVPPAPTEKFILRGTAITGDKKSALIQKIIPDEKTAEENLILELGDTLNGKKIIDIDNDSLTLDDNSKIFIDTN